MEEPQQRREGEFITIEQWKRKEHIN